MDITNTINQLDKSHVFDAIDAQPGHLRLNFVDGMDEDVTPAWAVGITNIVLAGMGGSALGADLLKTWLDELISIPFEIVRDYALPGYVDERTLVIVSSASGNTEEELAVLMAAQKRSARIVVMASAGKLLDLAREKDYLLIQLPHVTQPRISWAGFKALACLVSDMGLVGTYDLRRELEDVADRLDVAKTSFNLDANIEANPAIKLARTLMGQPVLVYAGSSLAAVAYKWKININESAKQLAFCNVWPELNHNEMQGWLFPEVKPLAMVELSSPFERPRILRRIEVTNDVLEPHGYRPQKVVAKGETPLEALLWMVLYGDYVAAYLGILNGIDPTPVELVESFKSKLG